MIGFKSTIWPFVPSLFFSLLLTSLWLMRIFCIIHLSSNTGLMGLPGGTVVKNSPSSAGDVAEVGSIPVSGRSPGGGNGNPLQYSCLENPMDRGAWWATVHGVTKSRTQLNTHTQTHWLNSYTSLFYFGWWLCRLQYVVCCQTNISIVVECYNSILPSLLLILHAILTNS